MRGYSVAGRWGYRRDDEVAIPIWDRLSQAAQPEIEKPILLVSGANGAKKPVRYEATRENWKRYRSANDRPSP
jgi:hypothetical protein